MEKDSSGRWYERHSVAIAAGSAVVAGLAGVAAAEGVRRLRGAANIRHAKQRGGSVDPTILLSEQVATYKNGTIILAVAALLIHPDRMEYGKAREAMGLSRHQVSHPLGFLTDNRLAQRIRNEDTGLYYIQLDPAVPRAIHDNPDAYERYIAKAKDLYPPFDVEWLGPEPNLSDNS